MDRNGQYEYERVFRKTQEITLRGGSQRRTGGSLRKISGAELQLKEVLGQFDTNSLVTALMGASPETNCFCERLFPDIDFEMTRKNIGRIRIEIVEDMQNQIVAMINLQAVDKEI